ncbi:serine/threonine protein kinase PknK [Gordonia sinesedis]
MDSRDTESTQRDLMSEVVSELGAAGFSDAQEIGHGGFGVVFRCHEDALNRTVAVKVIPDDVDGEERERFVREQRAMGTLSGHPNIAGVLQVGATGHGLSYIVMPYYAAGSLDTRLTATGPLPWEAVVRIGIKIAGALAASHGAGILHRDVKPGNILLSDYGEPQLTDFGIAHMAGAFETSAGQITASPAYTAPEVLTGQESTPAADVYGLGATLFCLLTGHAAYARRNGEHIVTQFLRISSQPIPDLREHGIPPDLSTVIERAMTVDPSGRPASARDLAAELAEVQRNHGLPIDTVPAPTGDLAAPAPAPAAVAEITSRSERHARYLDRIAPPSVATKFRPPTPSAAPVPRARLIDTLTAGREQRFVLIHGPAGFGKSTLAAQWTERARADGETVAWLTVDHDDNNVVWFLAHLVEAIRGARPELAGELGLTLEEHPDSPERYVLPALINEIHTSGRHITVVIDEWHRVTDPASMAALDFLLTNGCHHLQIIVTSRTQAGLPLARLRVQNDVLEIDATALRFDEDESRSLLVGRDGHALTESAIAHLTRSTEGWAAALQLASLSLRGRDDPSDLIDQISGRHHAIAEYLVENVLDTVDPDIVDFMLATSIPERVNCDLACALTGRDDGQRMLEEIERRDLFLQSLDDEREWFRYHNLFAEFLGRRLQRDSPRRATELHATAAGWFADHGMVSEAVDHALAAGDPERAVALVESCGMDLIEHSRMATVLGLAAKLPASLAASRPRLQLDLAWANVLLQRLPRTGVALDNVAAGLSGLDDGSSRAIRVEAAVARDVSLLYQDRIIDISPVVRESLDNPEGLRPVAVAAAANLAAAVALYDGDYATAHEWERWATKYYDRSNGPFASVIGGCVDGIVSYAELDIPAAERSFREALDLAHDATGMGSHARQMAGALLGGLLYAKGELAEADRLLEASYELGGEGGFIDFMVATFVTGARVKAALGDDAAARQRLDEGLRTAEALELPRLAAAVRNAVVRAGEPPPDLRLTVEPPAGSGIARMVREVDEDTAIRLLMRSDSTVDRAAAVDRATTVRDGIDPGLRPRDHLLAELLLVGALQAAGRSDDAQAVLAPAAARCDDAGLSALLADAGIEVAQALTLLRGAPA